MSEVTRINGDLVVIGAFLGATEIAYPTGSITNAAISASAAIAASKSQRSFPATAQQSGTVADETIIIHIVQGSTGILKSFTCSQVTAPTGVSTFTVDLQKNGVTMLSAPVTVNAATGALGEATGTLTVTALADGDVLTVVIDATASGTDTPATGAFAMAMIDEDYAS